MTVGSALNKIRRAALSPRRSLGAISGKAMRQHSYWLGNGRSIPPASVCLFMTYRCNLRCKMCDLWGENGSRREGTPVSTRSTQEELSQKEIRTLVDDLASFKPKVTLFGGEPLFHGRTHEVLQCLRDRNIPTSIITNGVLLGAHFRQLVDLKVDEITISLDGPREVHDSIRGVQGTYDKAIAGIVATAEYKRRKHSAVPRLKVLYTISDMNFRHLNDFVKGLEGLQLDLVNFYHVMFVNEELLRRHNAVFMEAFGITSNSLRGFARDVSSRVGLDDLAEQISLIKTGNHRVPVEFLIDFTPEELRRYYTDFSFSPKSRCLVPWREVLILPDGSVSPCLDFIAGNVREESFLRIWNGPRFIHFRRTLKRLGKFPACNRCCLLYRD
ncbi:MAG: radical SAM protein [Chloroflexi bacterium]|nr:radical SAM protein [Chloroflexota bacterium]MDA8187330.1 radical SAM protein [Dehalococcoidales bacterium]